MDTANLESLFTWETWSEEKQVAVKNPELITLRQMVTEMDKFEKPLSVIFVGADRGFKKVVIPDFKDLLGEKRSVKLTYPGKAFSKQLKDCLKSTQIALIDVIPQTAIKHTERHNLVTFLRHSGAESIVVVYFAEQFDLLANKEDYAISNVLLNNPPTAEGIEALLTIHGIIRPPS